MPVATMELRSDLTSPEVPQLPHPKQIVPGDPQLQAEATVSRVGWPALFWSKVQCQGKNPARTARVSTTPPHAHLTRLRPRAQGALREGSPSLGDERPFLAFPSGIWSLLKTVLLPGSQQSLLFLSVSTEAACHPLYPWAHARVYTQALSSLSPGPQVHAGLGVGVQEQWPGVSEPPLANPRSASGLWNFPLCWSPVCWSWPVSRPLPFTWAACFQGSWPLSVHAACQRLRGQWSQGEAAGFERFP